MAGYVAGGTLVAVWLLLQLVGLIEGDEEQLGLAIALGGLAVVSAIGSVQQKRAEQRARALEAAYAKIAQAARTVGRASSPTDLGRAKITLGERIADAGRVGAPSPLWTLPDTSVAEIGSAIGAIQAEAEYRRGMEARRRRRRRLDTIGAFVTAVATFVGTALAILQTVGRQH